MWSPREWQVVFMRFLETEVGADARAGARIFHFELSKNLLRESPSHGMLTAFPCCGRRVAEPGADVRLHLWRRYFPLHMVQQRSNAQHETADDLPMVILRFALRSLL